MEAAVDHDDYHAEARDDRRARRASRAAASSGIDRRMPAGERAGLRGLGRGGAGARRRRLPPHPARGAGRRVADATPSAPTSASSATAGLPFDMCFLARQLPIALELARACDGHRAACSTIAACPTSPAARLDPWRAGLDRARRDAERHRQALRRLRLLRAGRRRRCETVRPYVEHVIETFGPDRCLWGSDWPVVNGARRPAELDRRLPRASSPASPRTSRRRWRTAPPSGSTGPPARRPDRRRCGGQAVGGRSTRNATAEASASRITAPP